MNGTMIFVLCVVLVDIVAAFTIRHLTNRDDQEAARLYALVLEIRMELAAVRDEATRTLDAERQYGINALRSEQARVTDLLNRLAARDVPEYVGVTGATAAPSPEPERIWDPTGLIEFQADQ